MPDKITIDLAQCPHIEMKGLCEVLLEAAKRFYEDPANNAAFEEWLAHRKTAP